MSFSFGTPSSAPATTGLTGFNFGANKPATTGFGLTSTPQASTGLFGAPQPDQQQQQQTSTALPGFGATATPAFGTTTPAFGTGTPAFGATSTAPAFGTATPAFGATATPAFGATATPALGASAAPTFGATTTPSFGTTGLGTTGLGAGGLNFGTGSNTSTPGTGLTFGAPTATTAAPGLGGSFGFGAASTQSTGFGLFGSTSTATTSTSLFGAKLGTTSVTGTLPSISATPSFGLGGVAPTTSGIGATSTTTDAKSEPPKQNKLPNEISTTVDSFKEFVKKQKSLSSEVMRVSIKPLHKVSREAESTLRAVVSLGGEVSRARAHSRRLRAAAAAALAAAEAATRDYTSPGLELEGTAPPQYVKDLISELEQQLITFRRQMDVADKQMQSSPKLLSEQELTLGIRRMHESLVALAGRLQAVHTQVEAQKEQYLNLRKYVLKDPTNVFDAPNTSTSLDQILRDAETNRKKMKSGALADVSHGLGSAVLSDPRAALGNLQHLAGPTPFTYVGSALSPFPTADTTGPTWQPQSQASFNTSLNISGFGAAQTDSTSGFQLQKPPGKRGKQ
ncbi:nuclear pore complex protein Nup58 [Anticarsia gemmatalis]|uniref:nuclear pore complex protein Nup58 n=1 Tax=Anticarsia gemmatalis TaxID=129554 RepID=UPI003F7654C4